MSMNDTDDYDVPDFTAIRSAIQDFISVISQAADFLREHPEAFATKGDER